MRPIVTDQVAWSVGRLVCHTSELYKNGWTDRDAVWVVGSDGPKKSCVGWGSRSPDGKGQFWGKGAPIVKYQDFLPWCWAVRKRLNRSICCLDCGLRWTEGSTSSIVFARWRQCALMAGHVGATWRI